MKVLSLFDGISCGRIALEKAGIEVEQYAAFEIDKYAIQVSKENYPSIKHYGDVFVGDFSRYKDFDLLIGGSPCTYWSIARNKDEREITSSGFGFELFNQYVRALHESNVKYFLYENNKSIHKDIQNEISKALNVNPIMIDSSLLSAQQRKRLYWTNIPNVQQPEDKGLMLKDILEENPFSKYFITDAMYAYLTDMVGGGNYCRGKRFKPYKDLNKKAYCVTTGEGTRPYCTFIIGNFGENQLRRLTPMECERLQTLPDNYTKGISNTQRYKAIGNGWTVDVIAHILKHI